jgi:hypothetical protein
VFVFDILSQVSIVAYGAGIDDDNDDGDAGDDYTGAGDDDGSKD